MVLKNADKMFTFFTNYIKTGLNKIIIRMNWQDYENFFMAALSVNILLMVIGKFHYKLFKDDYSRRLKNCR